MENLFYVIITMFSIIGWYILLKEIASNLIFKNIKLDSDIELHMIVKNKENNIEILLRKLIYIQEKIGYFNKIEIIDNNSTDKTYEILKKMQEQYPIVKVRKML